MKTVNIIKKIDNRLISFLKNNKDIVAVYLFGSLVKKSLNEVNDIDIALLLSDSAYKKTNVCSIQTKFEIKLKQLIGNLDIDVTILNDAPFLLRHEVFKNGELLFERDSRRCDFEVNSELKYFDFEPYRRLFWEGLKKKILKHGN